MLVRSPVAALGRGLFDKDTGCKHAYTQQQDQQALLQAQGEFSMKTASRPVAWIAIATLLVALGVALSFWTYRQTEETAKARSHTYIVLNSADDLLSELRDAETGQRGYLLTGDETFLEPYLAVRNGIVGRLHQLQGMTSSSAAQKHLDAMAPLVDAKLAELAQVIELRRHHDMTAAMALVSSGAGKRLMDSIRLEMKSFTEVEEGALAQHDAEFQSDMRYLFALIVGASLSALLFALAFAYLIYQQTQQRIKERDHLETRHLLELQQQANVTLQVSEEKLAVTLNSISDGVIATDALGRVMLLDRVADRLTGWTQEQASGRAVDEIFHIINQEPRQPAVIPV